MAGIGRRGLITMDGVKGLIAQGTPFQVRYELVGDGTDGARGIPKYRCIYEFAEHGSDFAEYVLVTTRFGPHGPQPREIGLWPGLVRHHVHYHPELDLCISSDWTLHTAIRDGSKAPAKRGGKR